MSVWGEISLTESNLDLVRAGKGSYVKLSSVWGYPRGHCDKTPVAMTKWIMVILTWMLVQKYLLLLYHHSPMACPKVSHHINVSNMMTLMCWSLKWTS